MNFRTHWPRMTLATAIILCVVCINLFRGGCENGDDDSVMQVVPIIYQATNSPEAQPYLAEFIAATNEPVQLPVPLAEMPTNVQTAKIEAPDHNVALSLWAVLAHSREHYYDNQKIYVYADTTRSWKEISALEKWQLESVFIFSNAPDGGIFLLADMAQTLWAYNPTNDTRRRICGGDFCKPSPDHSKLAFWRTDGSGFYSIHVLDIASGKIANVISLREHDPGSGTSWNLAWSKDSKVLRIVGSCSGFRRYWRSGRINLNLMYLLNEKKMFEIPGIASPY